MDDIRYIEENYIEGDELCSKMQISSHELNQLINSKRIPKPSYEVTHKMKICSPLNDSVEKEIQTKYFPLKSLELLKQIKQKQEGITKLEFKKNLYQVLEAHPYKSYAYQNIVKANGNIDPVIFDKYAEEKWRYYISGVYGICTQNVSVEEIVRKGIVVRRLKEFQENNHKDNELLKALDKEYNEVAMLFAPYQRQESSRGKYLDATLKKNKLEGLIKKYS